MTRTRPLEGAFTCGAVLAVLMSSAGGHAQQGRGIMLGHSPWAYKTADAKYRGVTRCG